MDIRRLVRAAVIGLAVSTPIVARADVVTGTVNTRARAGVAAATAVVYAEPVGAAPPQAPARNVAIRQKSKTFSPRVLAVPVGTTLQFPNDDQVFHNVFSLSPGNTFDMGLYRAGTSKSRTITAPGTMRVFCNIHPQMTAFVVAAATPWIVTADGSGAWRLDVPPGRYRLTALSERAAAVTVEVDVAGTAAVPPLLLDETAFVAAQHMNKFGKPYPAEAYRQ